MIAPEGLERYLQTLPFLGTLSASHRQLTAGALEEILLVYEVGASGIADSGRLKLTFRFYSDWGELQTSEPGARDYVSARFVPRRRRTQPELSRLRGPRRSRSRPAARRRE